MSESSAPENRRSYGCTFGCGNPYDYILVSVQDGSTELLCLPCMIKLAADMVTAITDPSNETVQQAMQLRGDVFGDQTPGPSGKPRGKNAPATAVDDDLFEEYDGVVTVEDLPDEFR